MRTLVEWSLWSSFANDFHGIFEFVREWDLGRRETHWKPAEVEQRMTVIASFLATESDCGLRLPSQYAYTQRCARSTGERRRGVHTVHGWEALGIRIPARFSLPTQTPSPTRTDVLSPHTSTSVPRLSDHQATNLTYLRVTYLSSGRVGERTEVWCIRCVNRSSLAIARKSWWPWYPIAYEDDGAKQGLLRQKEDPQQSLLVAMTASPYNVATSYRVQVVLSSEYAIAKHVVLSVLASPQKLQYWPPSRLLSPVHSAVFVMAKESAQCLHTRKLGWHAAQKTTNLLSIALDTQVFQVHFLHETTAGDTAVFVTTLASILISRFVLDLRQDGEEQDDEDLRVPEVSKIDFAGAQDSGDAEDSTFRDG
ncbi:hypothetical protein BC629DRAFT_1442892 [Irpex lacteus]|nr:hypothetical protein BC629DRAFT_1442892 [Irpex lacteus]